jgi:hypothetical protein
MTPHDDLGDLDDPVLEFDGEQSDPTLAPVFAELDHAYSVTPPPHLRAAMDHVVSARLTALRHPVPTTTRFNVPALRERLTVARLRVLQVVAAVALVAAGMAGTVWLGSQPASAEAILDQAAAFHLIGGQAAHLTYQVTLVGGQKNGISGTADVWVQANASGSPVLSAQTFSGGRSPKGLQPGTLVSRYIHDGQQIYAFDAGHDAILVGSEARDYASWIVPPEIFFGVSVAQDLRALAGQSPQHVQELPPRTIDGRQVDVIQVTGWLNRPAERSTFYFDSRNFLLRGFDITSIQPAPQSSTWQARLTSDTTLAASAVPSGAFTLNAPAGARAEFHDLTIATLASVCHGTPVTKSQLRSGHETPLSACRANAPGMTSAALIAALAAPYRAQLDAAVSAGQITAAQEADSLAMLNAQLAAWINSSGGAGQ